MGVTTKYARLREKEGRQHRIYGGWYEVKILVADHFARKAGL